MAIERATVHGRPGYLGEHSPTCHVFRFPDQEPLAIRLAEADCIDIFPAADYHVGGDCIAVCRITKERFVLGHGYELRIQVRRLIDRARELHWQRDSEEQYAYFVKARLEKQTSHQPQTNPQAAAVN